MDTKSLKTIMDFFEESSVQKFEYEDKKISLKMEKMGANVTVTQNAIPMQAVPQVASNNTPAVEVEDKIDGEAVKAPLVGTVYLKSSPEADNYVKVGDSVSEGDTLCIVEAMKVMNEIKAPTSGIIKKICVDAETLVEFDQDLFIIG